MITSSEDHVYSSESMESNILTDTPSNEAAN